MIVLINVQKVVEYLVMLRKVLSTHLPNCYNYRLVIKAANCSIELARNCSSGGWFVFQRERNQTKAKLEILFSLFRKLPPSSELRGWP